MSTNAEQAYARGGASTRWGPSTASVGPDIGWRAVSVWVRHSKQFV